ncbi:hypothetical protein BASA81_007830 [Batrachochytrium salamandrivorans]|nr:hypothetical protein BASA81_007830 [Batrachochytrium salamandrivorans]
MNPFSRRPSLSFLRPSSSSSAAVSAPAARDQHDPNLEEKASFSFHDAEEDDDDNVTVTTCGTAATKRKVNRPVPPRLSELLQASFSSFRHDLVTPQPGDTQPAPPPVSGMRQFFHGRSPSFSVPSTSSADSSSQEVAKLAEAIQHKRKQLIDELLGLDGDAIVKVRFISAVDQFERCQSKDEKKHMGQKLVEIFIPSPLPSSPPSQMEELGQKIADLFTPSISSREKAMESFDDQSKMFVINSISEDTVRRLGNGYLSHLSDAKHEVLRELGRNMLVMQAVSNVESNVKW